MDQPHDQLLTDNEKRNSPVAAAPFRMVLSRRAVLAGLIGVGALIVLPVPLAEASDAQLEPIWAEQIAAPFYFEVSEYGTINAQGEWDPHLNSDVFSINTSRITSPSDLVSEIDGNGLLQERFEQIAEEALWEAQDAYDNGDRVRGGRKRLQAKIAAIEKGGWEGLIEFDGEAGLQRYKAVLNKWLAERIDFDYVDYWPRSAGLQGEALCFFENLGRDVRNALGVVIVEGDHPGSSYFAAELQNDIADANKQATLLGLPFRFREEGAGLKT